MRRFCAVLGFVSALGCVARAGSALAPTLDSAFAARLRRARVPADIERLRHAYDHARIARVRCGLQTERELAPLACYEVLELELAWSVRPSAEGEARLRQLNTSCARAADRLRVPDVESLSPAVSAECRSRVREAAATNRYRAGGWSTD